MFWRYNYLGVSWAVFILILCGLPGDQFRRSKIEHADMVIHAFLFGVLAFLLVVGFWKQSTYRTLRFYTMRKVFVLCVLYGVIVELLQATVFIDRSIELSDMMFNALGTVMGLITFSAIYGYKPYW
jgi:VanZ family protein